METSLSNQSTRWHLWKKIIFRFFFIYLVLQMAPWTWLDQVPGVSYVTQYYSQLLDWAVNAANAKFFHVAPALVPLNGSGDTSYGWTMLWLFLSLAVIGCIVWSIADRKRLNYLHLNYWLCLFARYYVAMFAFTYGIVKIFAMQMYFPNLHQLATPLGDYLPMRLSWMFIGYSKTYQVFSGIMETLAGVLLVYRRTTTLGILLATGVFINVMMLNLSYDIPVKIFAIQLVLVCLFLVANESERIICFFILNKPAPVCLTYHFKYTKKWMRVTRVVLKVIFILVSVGLQLIGDIQYYQSWHNPPAKQPIKNGLYEVTIFNVNKKNIPFSLTDTVRWQDVIFEDGMGSIKTSDTSFRQRYKRGYFYYSKDKKANILHIKKLESDSLFFMNLHYDLPDSNTVILRGVKRKDSLYVELKRINKHFQLTEKQFHWLSEHNR